MKLDLSVTPVVIKTRLMKVNCTKKMADDLRDVQDINLEDMIVDAIKSQYTNDVNELFCDEDD